ncbi:MAG TPA: ABC transporter permease, partial [Xanthobacteraceae bacterium]|nr:ABC transporter permease [Xanthobacteraceae bacterium]
MSPIEPRETAVPVGPVWDRPLRVMLPLATLALAVLAWELVVRINHIPPYVLPAPTLVAQTIVTDWQTLGQALLVTLTITVEGFVLAVVGGVGLAILF